MTRSESCTCCDLRCGEFFLDPVLRQALGEGAEVDLVERLVLVEAGEDVGGLAGLRVDVGSAIYRAATAVIGKKYSIVVKLRQFIPY